MIVPSAAATDAMLEHLRRLARREGDDRAVRVVDTLAAAHRSRTVSTAAAVELVTALLDPPDHPTLEPPSTTDIHPVTAR